ncbi:hypothetical protein H8S95_06325 [Pontibacter sp. KCTC 32443]|uniref:hypothetical protein n=1 Tax=Pontibacter TaxID=323449 RepID=UPI00164EB092|nr:MULTISPECIES: hypothetical protein [Pontibacter]MBC5773671.1 hypothetical protein [Pontibacter sp. KCTC 32443]
MKLYLMDGEKPLTQVELSGNSFDFSGWQKYYAAADNIRFEITQVSFTYNKGEETGSFPGSVHKSWPLKTK